MELAPILAITSLGIVSFCLMLAAFASAARSPRFPDVPPGTRLPGALPRRLMLTGAALGAAFGFLMLLPGVLPWANSWSDSTDLVLGAATSAVLVGFTLRTLQRKPSVGQR
jgi:hypothetical protein